MKSESESCSVVSNSLWPHGLQSPQNSLGQNTGVGSFSLLQGIFPTQGLNPGFPHCRQILSHLLLKTAGIWIGTPPIWPKFSLNSLISSLKALSPNTFTQGLGLQHVNFGGTWFNLEHGSFTTIRLWAPWSQRYNISFILNPQDLAQNLTYSRCFTNVCMYAGLISRQFDLHMTTFSSCLWLTWTCHNKCLYRVW